MLTVRPIFDSLAVVGGCAVLLFLVLACVPPRVVSPERRRVLGGLRGATFLLLLAGMLRPSWVQTRSRVEPAALVVLADSSRSMTVSDVDGGSRWQAVRQAIDRSWPKLAGFEQLLTPQIFHFHEDAHPLVVRTKGIDWPQQADGDQTDLGGALEHVLRAHATTKLSAVVLLSDGAHRAAAARHEPRQAARELARRGVPLYTVVFGQGRNQDQNRDVSIASFADQFSVFVGNELSIQGSVRVRGYGNRAVPVQLFVTDPGGDQVRLGPVNVMASAESEVAEVAFAYTPTTPGEYRLVLRATPQPGEQVTENNELGAFLNVLDGGLRILYLEGNLGWQEQKFLRRSIDGSPDLDLDFAWVDVRDRERWPIDLGGILARQRYDVLILGDVHGDALGRKNASLLADRIDEGLGFMLHGGAHSFGAGGYASLSELSAAIPVTMSKLERRDPEATPDPRTQWTMDLQATPTREHFITQRGAGADADWDQLPPLRGGNRLVPSETGRVLLEGRELGVPRGSGPVPLLIASEFGRGRVLASGMDSTFRWYRQGYAEAHRRFWRQVILWLAGKDAAQSGSVWLDLDHRRVPSGSAISLTAGARDEQGRPLGDVELAASIAWESTVSAPEDSKSPTSESLTTEPLTLARREQAWQGSTGILKRPGIYRIDLRGTRQGQEYGTATSRVIVTQQDLELSDPVANPQELQLLAAETEAAGGRAVAAEQLPALFQEISAKRRQQRIEYQERWQLGDTLLDSWAYFLLLIGFLSAEWYLRRRWSV